MLMFGREPKSLDFPSVFAFEPQSYQAPLQTKLVQLRDLVEVHVAEASNCQKENYDLHTKSRTFATEDPVWLLVPNAGPSGKEDGKYTCAM